MTDGEKCIVAASLIEPLSRLEPELREGWLDIAGKIAVKLEIVREVGEAYEAFQAATIEDQ